MIRAIVEAESQKRRFLELLRAIFLLIAAGGFVFYGVDHWVIEHYATDVLHWSARIPLWVSVVGFPLTMLAFFTLSRWVVYPLILWMIVSVLTGLVGTVLHLFYNAAGAQVSVFTLSGFAAAMDGYRPVMAALAHTHVGFVGLIPLLTLEGLPWTPKPSKRGEAETDAEGGTHDSSFARYERGRP
ncbi:MAG: hypothetical protein U5K81_14100 [Trueperaceae bacterium]|nr:hypothetical protein [Trueperaceae bacterium]